jgi:NAD(P)-dependent dehydrogenase (short-subunit alcohol dehydrogenase family)
MAPTFDISPKKRAGFPHFLYRQLFVTPPPVTNKEADLTGKTAIITGANGGLGVETGRQLLDLGCNLILAVRDIAKGEKARQTLSAGRNLASDAIQVWQLDLSDYTSITSFAEKAKGLEHLDIVILNAGLHKMIETFAPTGYEEAVQVNYLSTMLLAILFAPILKEKKSGTEPGRIVIVNSDTAAWAAFAEQSSKPLLPAFKVKMAKWDGQERYSTSKLLGQLFLTELAERIPASDVIITCANCGLCKGSDLGRQFTGVGQVALSTLHTLVGRECSVGARTFIHGATTLGKDAHGQYLEDAKIQP